MVKSVLATGWLFEESRGNYGKVVLFSGGSSIAMLANNYFDRAWENSVPLPIPTIFEPIKWALHFIRYDIFAAAFLLIIGVLIFYFKEAWRGDAIFAILPSLLVVGIALRRSWRRFIRAKDIIFLK